MATQIPIGTAAYLTDFEHGQGAGASTYVDYAPDHDINYKLLRLTINQIIVEISAVSGPNAVAALDLVLWDDVDNPISAAEQNYGVVGAASYEVSVEGGGTLKIKKGQAFVNGQRVSLVSTMTGVTSSGGAGTRWVAIDANGAVFVESSVAQKSLDIASVTWNGTIFTGTPTHLADVFFDGDSWAEVRNRIAAGAGFPAVVYRRVSERFEFIEKSLGAATGGASVIAIPPGAVGAPGLVQKDGAGAADTTTGWYRLAADVWAFAVSGVQRLQLVAQGIAGILGSVGAPTYSFAARLTTGLYSPAAGVAGLAGGGELAVEAGSIAAGGVGLPNLLRCKGATVTGGFTLANATWDVVDCDDDPDEFDVSGWHDPAGANPDQFVVPTNGDGVYRVTAHALFDVGTPDGDRGLRITLGGTAIPETQIVQPAPAALTASLVTSAVVSLVATNVLRVEAYESDTGAALDVVVTFSVARVA